MGIIAKYQLIQYLGDARLRLTFVASRIHYKLFYIR